MSIHLIKIGQRSKTECGLEREIKYVLTRVGRKLKATKHYAFGDCRKCKRSRMARHEKLSRLLKRMEV